MQRRNTNQKALLYQAIDMLGHTDTEGLRKYLGNESGISLATIYRNLSILTEEGKIRKLKLGTSEVFETVKNEHYHFQCTCCKRITDVPITSIKAVEIPAFIDGNEITGHDMIFFGVCRDCKNKKKEDTENEEVCM